VSARVAARRFEIAFMTEVTPDWFARVVMAVSELPSVARAVWDARARV